MTQIGNLSPAATLTGAEEVEIVQGNISVRTTTGDIAALGSPSAVISVESPDGTLAVSPTTGDVDISLDLSHANTWTGQQTFVAPVLGTPASGNMVNVTGLPLDTGTAGVLPASKGGTGLTSFGTGVSDALGQPVTGGGDIVLQTAPSIVSPVISGSGSMTGGLHLTPYNIGTVSSGTKTIDFGNNPAQYLTNNGAFTLAAPTADGSCILLITNGSSAGAITFSGFTVGSTGDALDTVNTHKFMLSIFRINGVATYVVKGLQ